MQKQVVRYDGRTDEAEAARADAEELRRALESTHRGLHEEHILRATANLEGQIEAQLKALRRLDADGATDDAEVKKEIARLETALAALRQ